MKQSKSPTRSQKILISSFKYKPENWLVAAETKEELTIVHRHTGTIKVIRKDL